MSYLAYSKELIKKKIYKNILQYKHILVLLPLKKKEGIFVGQQNMKVRESSIIMQPKYFGFKK